MKSWEADDVGAFLLLVFLLVVVVRCPLGNGPQ